MIHSKIFEDKKKLSSKYFKSKRPVNICKPGIIHTCIVHYYV